MKIIDKCALLSTVTNFDLYSKTSKLFPEEIPHYIIDGSNGMYGIASIHYMFKILKNKNIEWLIMADEDVIFQNNEKVLDLIEYMKDKKYDVAGVRERGIISHKKFNPFAINTFFCILHFSEIEKAYNKKEIKNNQYFTKGEFSENLDHLQGEYDISNLYEPYYCFFLWLKRKGFNFLYLSANSPFQDDDLTTAVYGPEKDLLLYHTWYARAYGVSPKHTTRINKVLKEISIKQEKNAAPIIFKDKNYGWKLRLKKKLKKLKMKFD